jgi:hypothetical protein
MAAVYLIIRGVDSTGEARAKTKNACKLGPAWNGGVAVDSPSSLSVTSNGHCLPWWPWVLARPASLLLAETSTSRQGLRLKSSTTLEFHARHCQRQPHAGRTKAPSLVPDNLEHVYERAGGAALGLGNSQQQHARARGEAAPVAQPCRSAEPAGSSPRFQSAVRGGRANDQAAQIRSGPTTPPD